MSVFKFKYFTVLQSAAAMKVGTDAMLLGAFIETENKTRALDIGTGTGVLSLMLAQQNENLQITGVEIDQAAAEEAILNFKNSLWTNRLQLIHNDFLKQEFSDSFDLIVSNPPYFATTNENNDSRKAQARHVSSLEVKPFIEKVQSILSSTGSFWIIIPYIDFESWNAQAAANTLKLARKIDVIGKRGNDPIRCILKFDLSSVWVKNESFCIRNTDNWYTDEYTELTKEFHGTELY
jgi:tRNA1Val (adenine37-N6)-methyltransferase